eukprot:g8503.t1
MAVRRAVAITGSSRGQQLLLTPQRNIHARPSTHQSHPGGKGQPNGNGGVDLTSSIKTIGVLGSGKMGTGIALLAAQHGFEVCLTDIKQKQLEHSIQFMQALLDKDVKRGRVCPAEAKAILGRVKTAASLDAHCEQKANIIIEAATENLPLKQDLMKALSGLTAPETILATNTSSISITKLAASSTRPENVIGMHFFQPVTKMQIVEIISGLETSPTTLATTVGLATKLGKHVTHSKNMPGFIANRLLMPYINEAILVLQEGTATIEDIDNTMKLGCAMPMGPLRLADFIGLDTVLAIMNVLFEGFKDSKYRPAPLLQQYVDAGRTGEKSGQGFFNYKGQAQDQAAKTKPAT